jgi:AraC-like DNA-binding protein
MREQIAEPLSLQHMAEIAAFSPYHFDRVFRQVTGIPPGRFLTALRMQAAKRLLLTTQLTVTEICFEVGYHSPGTFSAHFAQLVGLPARRLRSLAANNNLSYPAAQAHLRKDSLQASQAGAGIVGCVRAPESVAGPILVALFPTPIPQSQPVACSLLIAPGSYRIESVPDGRYHVFSTALPSSEDRLACLLSDEVKLHVGVGQTPLEIRAGQVHGCTDLTLHQVELIDPPILITLPFLLAQQQATSDGAPTYHAQSIQQITTRIHAAR